MDGNKRTGTASSLIVRCFGYFYMSPAFFLANEYLRAQGLPGLLDQGKIGDAYQGFVAIANRHIEAAAGRLDVEDLVGDVDSLTKPLP